MPMVGASTTPWRMNSAPMHVGSSRTVQSQPSLALPAGVAADLRGARRTSQGAGPGAHGREARGCGVSVAVPHERSKEGSCAVRQGWSVVLAGFSMGTGEVTRYLGRYGSAGVSKAVLLGVIPPFLPAGQRP